MIEFTIPLNTHLLVSELNRSGEHWTKKANRHRKQREVVKGYLKTFKRGRLPCLVELTRIAPRKLDGVNLASCMKWIQDCVADWLIPGQKPGMADSDERIDWIFRQRNGKPYEVALHVTISEVDEKEPKKERKLLIYE